MTYSDQDQADALLIAKVFNEDATFEDIEMTETQLLIEAPCDDIIIWKIDIPIGTKFTVINDDECIDQVFDTPEDALNFVATQVLGYDAGIHDVVIALHEETDMTILEALREYFYN